MNIEHFFDPETSTLTYLLADMATRECEPPRISWTPVSRREWRRSSSTGEVSPAVPWRRLGLQNISMWISR